MRYSVINAVLQTRAVLDGFFRANFDASAALHAIIDPGGSRFIINDVIYLAGAVIRTFTVAFTCLIVDFDGDIVAFPGIDGHNSSLTRKFHPPAVQEGGIYGFNN